jgi:hypothetical protein
MLLSMSPPGLVRTPDAVVLIPGVMGSELAGPDGKVVWGMKLSLIIRQAILHDALSRIALPADLKDDGIRASRLLALPVKLPLLTSIEPYSKLKDRLERVALRPEAVRAFPYDWRRSIEHAARQLALVVDGHFARWRHMWERLPLEERRHLPEPKITLVCHSMGGLVARWFAEVEGGREVIRQIITLGTPFAGSLNPVRVLSDGDYLPFGLFATALRETGRTLPGLYELVAHYRCVAEGVGETRRISASDLAGIGARPELAEAAFGVHKRLADAVDAAGGSGSEIRPLVGVQQPTLQGVSFSQGTASFDEQLEGQNYFGDGTVYRYAAAPRGIQAMPLPQQHGSLAKTDEAIAFVEAILTERDLGEVQAPPGFGIRVPEVVRPAQPFDVEVVDGEAGASCRVTNAETNAQVAAAIVRPRGEEMIAAVSVPEPGVYRVAVAYGGYTPVDDLVLVMAD